MPVLRFSTDHTYRLLCPGDIIKRQFFLKVIVYHSIRYLRPAITHIPPDYARSAPLFQSGLLNKKFFRLRLADLRQHCKLRKAPALYAEHIRHLVCHQLIAVISPVPNHQGIFRVVRVPGIIRDWPQIVLRNKTFQGRYGRTSMIAYLTDEMRAGMAVKISLVVIPWPPVMLLRHIQITGNREWNIRR